MRLLLASAELAPLTRVGGLSEAVAGLVGALRSDPGVHIDLVVPDYGDVELDQQEVCEIPVPHWAGWARRRSGVHPAAGPVHLVEVPGMHRPHPYVDPATGRGWADNDRRFFAFCAAVAQLVTDLEPELVHVNDWHTSAVLSLLADPPPSVLTIHNLAYQGNADSGWMSVLGPRAGALDHYGQTNPLAGAIMLADAVVAVSPHYANEITRPEHGMGLHGLLAGRGESLVGILNGIDTGSWDPANDPALSRPFGAADLDPRLETTEAVRVELGLAPAELPLVAMVTRLVSQKGVEYLLELVPLLETLEAQMVLLGSGDPGLAAEARQAATLEPARFRFVEGFDAGLARRLFAGSDLFCVPSRFEPCGLTQMQAMRYGSIPVVTDVGGLHDTVLDADAHPEGTGFVARRNDSAGWVDAMHRAVRAWRQTDRRHAIQRRGMTRDWSWAAPAARHRELYRTLVSA